jgi:hypothetical protein
MGFFPPGTYYAGGGYYAGGFGLLPPGGYGAYGSNGYGIALPAGGFEFANPGYPGYGVGYSAFGQLPYDMAMVQARNAFLAAEFNPPSYQPAQGYQVAALNEAFLRYRPQVIEPHATRPAAPTTALIDTRVKTVQLIPREKLMDDAGNVQWPAAMPNDPKLAPAKEAAEAAVKKAVQEYKANGRITVEAAAEARDKVAAFGTPVLERLRAQSPADAAGVELFLQSLDYSLSMMAGTAPRPTGLASRIDLTPGHTALTSAEIRLRAPKTKTSEAAPAAPKADPEPRKPARKIDVTPR